MAFSQMVSSLMHQKSLWFVYKLHFQEYLSKHFPGQFFRILILSTLVRSAFIRMNTIIIIINCYLKNSMAISPKRQSKRNDFVDCINLPLYYDENEQFSFCSLNILWFKLNRLAFHTHLLLLATKLSIFKRTLIQKARMSGTANMLMFGECSAAKSIHFWDDFVVFNSFSLPQCLWTFPLVLRNAFFTKILFTNILKVFNFLFIAYEPCEAIP